MNYQEFAEKIEKYGIVYPIEKYENIEQVYNVVREPKDEFVAFVAKYGIFAIQKLQADLERVESMADAGMSLQLIYKYF